MRTYIAKNWTKPKKMIEPILTIEKKIGISLSGEERTKANKELCLLFFDDETCNKWNSEGKYVAKYPELETPEIKESFRNLHCSKLFLILIDIYQDGNFKIRLPE